MNPHEVAGPNKEADWALLRRFYEGEEAAFEELFNKHKNRVVQLAHRFVQNLAAAEDVAQDIFLKVYERKVKVSSEAKFTTWLYRVTVNKSLDVVRSRKLWFGWFDKPVPGEGPSEEEASQEMPDTTAQSPRGLAEEKELAYMVRKAVDELPDKFRLPILLYQFEELSYAEIASILSVSSKAVERRLSHAKQRLKERLKNIITH